MFHRLACAAVVLGGVVGFSVVAAASPGGRISVTPSPVAFGPSNIGDATSIEVTVSNIGTSTLTVIDLSIGGDPDFTASGEPAFPISLAVGASVPVEITYTPTINGSPNATLNIDSNDPTLPTAAIALTGCAGPPAIALDTNTLSFGNHNVATTSTAQTVNLTNGGCADLHVTSIALAGTNAGDFVLTPESAIGTLASQQTQPFTVAFAPTATGTRIGNVTFASDDPNGVFDSVVLGGTGTVGELMLGPTSLAFGAIAVSTTSTQQPITITNPGTGPLDVMSLGFSDASYTQTAGTTPPFTLGAGASATLDLACTPTTLGAHDATATVTTDAGSGSASGTVTLTCTGGAPTFAIAPAPVAFGAQEVGVASAPIAVTISNTGSTDLVVSSLAIGGADAADFASADLPLLPLTVGAGSSSTFHVAFTPSRNSAEAAALDLQTNDSTSPSPVVTMTGTGFQPGISVSPMTIDLGSVLVDATSAGSAITLTNTGDGDLDVTSFALTGANAAQFAFDQTAPVTIAHGTSLTMHVTFAPIAVGAASAVLNMSVTGLAPLTIALAGTGVSATLGVTPTSLDFGAVAVDAASPPQIVTITNSSTATLELSTIASTDLGFVVDTSATTFALAAGASTTFSVAFTPTMAGTDAAQINVSIASSATPIAQIAVTGDANAAPVSSTSAGGCCDAGRAPVPWSSLLLAGGLVAILRRRRL